MAAARTPPPLPSLPDAGEAPTPTWEPFPDASFGASAAGIAGRPLEGADLETAVMKEADAAADAAEDAVASAARAAAAAAAAPDDPEAVAAANAAAAAAAASQLAAGQLAYLLNVTRRDADLRQDEVSRLRKLAKRTRLNADDARTVSELREQLVSTQAELDAFKQRIVKHKEQFQQHVLVLREKTAKRLREIETLKARVAELETAQKTAHEEKLRIQDGAARALQAKDEEIERLKEELSAPRHRDEDFERLRDELAEVRAECAAEVRRTKAACAKVVERTKLKYVQELFIAQKTSY